MTSDDWAALEEDGGRRPNTARAGGVGFAVFLVLFTVIWASVILSVVFLYGVFWFLIKLVRAKRGLGEGGLLTSAQILFSFL